MNTFLHSVIALIDTALQGMAAPWLVMLALLLTTFLLEDVAIAAGAALASQGSLSWSLAFAAVAGGIALGDFGLYALGRAARHIPYLQRRYLRGSTLWLQDKLQHKLASAVLLARVIPGLRLLTYTLCGFVDVPMLRFGAWVSLAVTLWTWGLFWMSSTLGQLIANRLHLPVAVAVALPIVTLALIMQLLRYVRRPVLKNRIWSKP